MHRDHKLGLALGVLVIGFAGALCFPRQPAGSDISLELKDAAQLDADIELLPVRAYTEAESRPPAPEAATDSSQTKPEDAGPAPVMKGDADSVDLFAGPPEPIRPPASAMPVPVNTPLAETKGTPASTPTVEIPRKPPSGEPPGVEPQPRRYTVRAGDTLSGLAARFLGSSQRYREIFEANRDVLATPDAIRVGMVLTIPERPSPPAAIPDTTMSISEEPMRLIEVPEATQVVPTSSEQFPTPELLEAREGGTQPPESRGSGARCNEHHFRPAGRSPFIPGARTITR